MCVEVVQTHAACSAPAILDAETLDARNAMYSIGDNGSGDLASASPTQSAPEQTPLTAPAPPTTTANVAGGSPLARLAPEQTQQIPPVPLSTTTGRADVAASSQAADPRFADPTHPDYVPAALRHGPRERRHMRHLGLVAGDATMCVADVARRR